CQSGVWKRQGASLQQGSCFWNYQVTHQQAVCPWGYYVAGIGTSNVTNLNSGGSSDGSGWNMGTQTQWGASSAMLCCQS
ncbi:hypothetical protein, partial [Cupriavidus pinatubonensis]|uniref:hypothetical protein n=1 Tax=Cupriavidus pinatubonensis TaxID=248026 RepID=UPI001CC3BC1D